MRDLRLLPKAHLHVHLEAGMRPGTLAEMVAQQSPAGPVRDGSRQVPPTADGPEVGAVARVLRSRADWERLAEEITVDAAAEGCVYLEPAFRAAPYRDTLGADHEVWSTVLEIFRVAAARIGIGIGFVATVDPSQDSPTDARALAELAVTLRSRGVVGLGLDDPGAAPVHPPADFAPAFAVARAGGLRCVPHAGEDDEGRSVLAAVGQLGAVRVAHGVLAGAVPGLLDTLAADGICLDVCPTADRVLGVVPDTAAHPLPALLAAGVRCTLNADDPLRFGTTLLGEYEVARAVIGLDDATLARIARVSVEESRLPGAARQAALAGIVRWLAEDPSGPPASGEPGDEDPVGRGGGVGRRRCARVGPMVSPAPSPSVAPSPAPVPDPVEFTVDAILFDLDGTLIDSTGSVERNWGKLADRLGVPFAELEHHIHGVPLAQVLRRLYPGRYTEEEIAGHAAFLSEGESTDTAGIVAQPGARDLLQRLPAGRWTIVTSGDSRLAPARIAAAGLPTPAGMVTADQVALGKPHPEPYLLGAKRLGFEPGRCLVLEDAPAGVAAARAAGCPVIGLLTTHPRLDTLIAPSLRDVQVTVRENDLLVRVG